MSYDPVAPAAVSSRKTARNFTNGSGSTIVAGYPVSTLTNGLVSLVNVSSQTSVDGLVGIYSMDTPNTASGQVLDSGVLENISTGFSVGDAIYVNKAGALDNTVPSVGVGGFVSGDAVIFIGVIVQNEFNPSQKDLKILIEKPGTL